MASHFSHKTLSLAFLGQLRRTCEWRKSELLNFNVKSSLEVPLAVPTTYDQRALYAHQEVLVDTYVSDGEKCTCEEYIICSRTFSSQCGQRVHHQSSTLKCAASRI